MTELVFVHGVLLSPSYLRTLVPDARFVATAFAEGWHLEFDTAAFLVEHEGSEVFGAVYELPESALRTLDRARSADQVRTVLQVRTETGKLCTVQGYAAPERRSSPLPGAPPTPRYLELMETGYRAHNAPEAAWEALRAAHDRTLSPRVCSVYVAIAPGIGSEQLLATGRRSCPSCGRRLDVHEFRESPLVPAGKAYTINEKDKAHA